MISSFKPLLIFLTWQSLAATLLGRSIILRVLWGDRYRLLDHSQWFWMSRSRIGFLLILMVQSLCRCLMVPLVVCFKIVVVTGSWVLRKRLVTRTVCKRNFGLSLKVFLSHGSKALGNFLFVPIKCWATIVSWVPRDDNRPADAMAKIVNSPDFSLHVYFEPSLGVDLLLNSNKNRL
ncbi:hypothetical protein V6N12_004615 [Hibiscus sabdariffa]|uniref:RNase H type-1 domain-containing protein n=1 Tax=Hibiscus sabdariffa TaxID=183260 RepID=A0ABR2CMQ5_9ROSI